MKIYIAAPFFDAKQLALVEEVESTIDSVPGLTYYSPRKDGVLMAMTPEERKQKSREIFGLNIRHMSSSHAMVALLNDKDTGTTFELGYMFGYAKMLPVVGFKTGGNNINVMLQYALSAQAATFEQLRDILEAIAADERPLPHAITNTARVY